MTQFEGKVAIAADVLVVGGGGAGLAAAIEAQVAGCRVIVFEKNPAPGGSTSWSVGSISVNKSAHQARAGIEDDAQAHFEDLGILAGEKASRDNLVLRRLLVDNITETFEWLQSLGLVFLGPMPEPPQRVSRMHNVLPNSGAFASRLGRRARALGVEIRTDCLVEELCIEEGRVVGLLARGPEGPASFRAGRGVVLAGGDYSANPKMLAELAGAGAAGLVPVNPTATGDGIRLGCAAGGSVVNGDIIRGPMLRFAPPPSASLLAAVPPWPLLGRLMRFGFEILPRGLIRPLMMRFLTTALGLSPSLLEAGAILVDAEGRRIAEGTAAAVAGRPGGIAWVVFDRGIAARFTAWPHFLSTAPGIAYAYLDDYRRTRPDIFHRAQDIEALARAAGLAPAALAEAMARPIGDHEPPYYALGPVKAYVTFTDGGLNVNERLQVLDAEGQSIPGLYAAGANGQGGLLLEGHGHHLGWAFVSGRIAGRNAARFR